jgi:hypothetical protein
VSSSEPVTTYQVPAGHDPFSTTRPDRISSCCTSTLDTSTTSSVFEDSVVLALCDAFHEAANDPWAPMRLHDHPTHAGQDDIVFGHMDGHVSENYGENYDNDILIESRYASPFNDINPSHIFEDGSKAGDKTHLVCTAINCPAAARGKQFADKKSLR